MALLIVLLVAALVAVVAVLAGSNLRRRRNWVARNALARVVVHTTEGQSIEGSVAEGSDAGVLLRAARLIDSDVDLAGDVWVPAAKVHWVQQVVGR